MSCTMFGIFTYPGKLIRHKEVLRSLSNLPELTVREYSMLNVPRSL